MQKIFKKIPYHKETVASDLRNDNKYIIEILFDQKKKLVSYMKYNRGNITTRGTKVQNTFTLHIKINAVASRVSCAHCAHIIKRS